jgi:hypothetical protein
MMKTNSLESSVFVDSASGTWFIFCI